MKLVLKYWKSWSLTTKWMSAILLGASGSCEGCNSLKAKRMEKASDLTASTAEHFSGKPRMAGGAIVSPALLKHAAERAAQGNDILKQQRKAAEVRGLLKNGAKK